MNAITQAQRDVLRRLVDDGVLSTEQGEAVRAALTAASSRRERHVGWLAEVAGYVGGGLMLGGVALFLSTTWDELSQAARSGLLAMFACAFAIAGVFVAGGPLRIRRLAADVAPARRRIVGLLLALAAVPAALAVGVGVDRHHGLIGGLVGLGVAAVGLALLPTAAGVIVAATMSLVAVVSLGSDVLHTSSLGSGLLLVALGLAWCLVAVVRLVPTWHLGLAVGTGIALVGAQATLDTNQLWAYGLTAGLAVGSFLIYRWQRSVVLLAAGVIGMTVVVPEAVSDWTDGTLDGAVILMLAGAVLVAASGLGLRIRRSYKDDLNAADGT